MNKEQILSDLRLAINRISSVHEDVSKSDWNINTRSLERDIADVLVTGRSGLSYFLNALPSMEYKLANYKETGNVEDLDKLIELAHGYMDAVVKVRDAFKMLDKIAVDLRRHSSYQQNKDGEL